MKAFTPLADTVNIDVGAASARIALGNCDQVRVCNDGTATVWIKFGDGTVAATTTAAMPVRSGVIEVLSIPTNLIGAAPNVAAIAAGATGKIYFTPGTGL